MNYNIEDSVDKNIDFAKIENEEKGLHESLSNYKKELQMLNRKLQDRDNSILEMKDIISELRAMP